MVCCDHALLNQTASSGVWLAYKQPCSATTPSANATRNAALAMPAWYLSAPNWVQRAAMKQSPATWQADFDLMQLHKGTCMHIHPYTTSRPVVATSSYILRVQSARTDSYSLTTFGDPVSQMKPDMQQFFSFQKRLFCFRNIIPTLDAQTQKHLGTVTTRF